MSRRRPWIIAGCFGFGWLAVLYAGADHPPPSGFAVVVVIILGLVVCTGLLIPRLWRIRVTKGIGRALVLAVVCGVALGMLVAVALLIKGSGEPSNANLSAADICLWLIAACAVGAVNAGLVAVVAIKMRPPEMNSHSSEQVESNPIC